MPVITEQSPVMFNDALPGTADVVVIGAGIAGTATSYFLAQHGLKVVLCEKGRVAGEQSSRSFGWIRQQGRDAAELPVMMESIRIWRGLAGETNEADLEFGESGSCYLAENESSMADYEQWCDLARQHGLDTRMLSAAEARTRFPGLEGNWLGGMLTPSDGRGDHFSAVPALARAARRRGVSVIENCAVRTVDTEAGRLAGVITEKGRVRCGKAVLAAGAWSTHFAANAGIDLPQLAGCSSGARTEPCPEVFSVNLSMDGLSFLRRGDGTYTVSSSDRSVHYLSRNSFRYLGKFRKLLKGWGSWVRLKFRAPPGYPGAWGSPRRWSGDEVSPFERLRVIDPPVSPTVLKRIHERMPRRCPALKDAKLAEAWSGMIDVTPDAVPTLGEDPALEGLYIATGLSGHGFGIGPAIGRIMADLVRGAPPGHDLQRFRPTRFFDGSAIEPGPF
jgi:glycine/D-amino acid oxidase-like deaminating enzyme